MDIDNSNNVVSVINSNRFEANEFVAYEINEDTEITHRRLTMLDYHHHQVAPPARISLTLSHHPSLSSIAPGRFSRLHPVSAQSYCI